jgi:hypothetical protein
MREHHRHFALVTVLATRPRFLGESFVQVFLAKHESAFTWLMYRNCDGGAVNTTALFRWRDTLPAMTPGLEGQVSRKSGICLDLEIESSLRAGDRADAAADVFDVFCENASLLVYEHHRIFAAFRGIYFDHESHLKSPGRKDSDYSEESPRSAANHV